MRMWEEPSRDLHGAQAAAHHCGWRRLRPGLVPDWRPRGAAGRVEVIAAEGFERIHRTNLIGMGVLPLEFSRAPPASPWALMAPRRTMWWVSASRAPISCSLCAARRRGAGGAHDLPPRHRRGVSVYEAGGVL